jgi:uncharacterized protein involved in response to NO
MSTPRTFGQTSRTGDSDRQPAPLWRLGFRPFYLCASAFAALSILCWVAEYAGWIATPVLAGPLWHAHEMVFGFAFAVIAGFLFTAVRNWSNRPTPTGIALALIVALWVAGRVLVLTPFAAAAAVVNATFPLAVAWGIAVPLVASGNRRNYFFPVILVVAAVAVLCVHLAAMGVVDLPAWAGIQLALDLVLLVMVVIGGRVIPMFTANGVPGTAPRRDPRVEKAALAVVPAIAVADVAGLDGVALAILLGVAALVHGVRLALWQPWRTLRTPLVWVLHAGYAWIVAYLALRAAAALQWIPQPVSTHALTVGAIGGLTLGMMTRTSRGHTGRPLTVGPVETLAYALVHVAAAVRALLPLLLPGAYVALVGASAALWGAAFALFFVVYLPILTRPRIDGKPG